MSINWPSFKAFLDCQTQWNVVVIPMVGLLWIGLNYANCKPFHDQTPQGVALWSDIQVMEEAALEILNEGD